MQIINVKGKGRVIIMANVQNVFIPHLRNAGLFKGRKIPPQVSKMLRGLKDRDLMLNPAGGPEGLRYFGIDKPNLFKALNINGICIISPAARKDPKLLTSLIAEIARVKTPWKLYNLVVKGVKSGLLGIREPEIVPGSEDLDINLSRLIHESGLDFKLTEFSKDPKNKNIEVSVLETEDALTNQISQLKISTLTTIKDNEKSISIYVNLPWNSPNLIAKLNQLFGRSWYYKARQRIILPGNYKEIVCIWGSYRTPYPEKIKWECIKPILEDPLMISTAGRFDFRKIEGDKYPQRKNLFFGYVEKQLLHSIGTLASRPDMQDLKPAYLWDLGIVRNLARTE